MVPTGVCADRLAVNKAQETSDAKKAKRREHGIKVGLDTFAITA
jgi:hypothetical protein